MNQALYAHYARSLAAPGTFSCEVYAGKASQFWEQRGRLASGRTGASTGPPPGSGRGVAYLRARYAKFEAWLSLRAQLAPGRCS